MVEAACWDSRLYHSYRTFGGLYSSYPTKKQFTQTISAFERFSAVRISAKQERELAIYVHFPDFTKQSISDPSIPIKYLASLQQEIEILARLAHNKTSIQHLHFTGRPTQFNAEQLQQILRKLQQYFVIECHNLFNYSINVNPYEVSWATMGAVRDMGFNRINLNVHTGPYNFQKLQTIYEAARTLHYGSISIAMIYGLPKQSLQEFSQELEQVISLMPERITLGKHPKAACIKVLPQLLELAIEKLNQAGYHYVGLDCFVLPDDELISAQEAGLVSCNLQGFATNDDFDILGFGIAATSQMGILYYQNCKDYNSYFASLDNKQLPSAQGTICSTDDLIRRYIIHVLTNQNLLSISELECKFNISFFDYFSDVLPHLESMHQDGLINLSETQIKMTRDGYFLVDAVCQLFDRSFSSTPPDHALYTRIK